jgi:hypothetical protein
MATLESHAQRGDPYHVTNCPLIGAVGFTGFFQAAPFIFFGLFGGVLADTLNRKKLIAITHSLNIIPGLLLLTVRHDSGLANQRLMVLLRRPAGPRRPGAPGDHSEFDTVPSANATLSALTMQGTQPPRQIAGFMTISSSGLYFVDAGLRSRPWSA